ncbi:hypothetical protein [Spiroplasma endosymbiont of Polydrusus pterygomalis]|uniref:hypothetical protein n=1 Tax=Spiroplasma endosymbiont of Polydrusus pterygomalis TaxID=3139327 RepID=UPI003CCB2E16
MDNFKKNPDKKLYFGAKMGLITNIINIIWSIIIALILIVGHSIILDFIKKNDLTTDTLLSKASTLFIIIIVIAGLVEIGFSIAIIILCNNVLQGKADSGLVVSILTLVLAAISLISICFFNFTFITIINFLFLGFNIASGVLLIVGKYLPVIKPEAEVSIINK